MARNLLICTAAASFLLSTAAIASPVTYVGTLNSAAEGNPADTSPGTGIARITIDDLIHQLTVHVVFSGLQGTTTASHIHCCTSVAGTGNGGVATTVPTFAGFPLGVTAGTYDNVLDMSLSSSWNPSFITANGGTPLSAFAALSSGLAAGKSYLNIHTSTFGSGEIRAFLVAEPIPEPASAWLAFAALAALTVSRRSRQTDPALGPGA